MSNVTEIKYNEINKMLQYPNKYQLSFRTTSDAVFPLN